ncbi:hypothetical protein VitviT2T_029520 [Vitis vinifera]|uniref:Uncharacterized protein n=2 Tax=Vitis vinifera TaxID=29760 RepID=A0ABY9DWI9_VITVI|eukprot:XP_002285142.1 PREDICTED: uncharacterized protein LOC100248740 [Vitis vinifera]
MGKSSSSLRKKRSKNSSQVRKRKRSKSRSRRNKSKKLRRHDDSLSYSDDDTSRSSMLVSSSSSEENYRSRRARSRTRKDVKSSKKRARRSSPRRGSVEGSPRAKKRKGSKRNGDLDARKKAHKKKPRRDVSDSSMSSGSWSCSTCQGGNSSSGESEFERPRGRSERKERDKRNLGKVKHVNKRSRHRSRSCSSYSRCSESSGYQSVERWDAENNSRRLRSVITVVREPEEEDGRELDKDAHKEEIIYDHDDGYPSCRSNDSNDGGGKRELTYHSEKRKQIESGKEAFVSNIRTTEDKESDKDCGTQNDGSNPSFHGVKENKNEASDDIGHLESILRQRAIENLRKFRGVQTNAKTTPKDVTAAVKHSPTSKAELVQIKASRVDGTRAVSANPVVEQSNMPTVGREFTYSSQNLGKIPDGRYSENEPGASERGVVCPPEKVATTCAPNDDNSSKTAVNAFGNKSKPGTSVLRRESFGTSTPLKQASISQEPHRPNLLVTRPSVNTNSAATAQTVLWSSKDNGQQVSDTAGPAASNPPPELKPISGEQSSKEVQGEAKEGSQFEQKTMSVMRGGEMVQVSYKVYIPKKAPASGWRQLPR